MSITHHHFLGTGLQYFILFSMFYKKTYNTKKTDKTERQDSTEDLLEDLGNEVERVRRNSLKVNISSGLKTLYYNFKGC